MTGHLESFRVRKCHTFPHSRRHAIHCFCLAYTGICTRSEVSSKHTFSSNNERLSHMYLHVAIAFEIWLLMRSINTFIIGTLSNFSTQSRWHCTAIYLHDTIKSDILWLCRYSMKYYLAMTAQWLKAQMLWKLHLQNGTQCTLIALRLLGYR